jgi:glycosyltransferase involved in cell wall biosynthesis
VIDEGQSPAGVPVRLILPADPAGMSIGGIASFVRGFVRHAPADFDLSMVGTSATLALWRWHRVELEGRSIRFLPAIRHGSGGRGRLPVAAPFVAAVALRGRDLGRGVVSSFHRPMTDAPLRRSGPMWRVVHLGVGDLTTTGSESRWARLRPILAGSERRSFHRMDRIYVVNRRLADAYRREFPDLAGRIAFLPNWIDPEVFHPVGPDEAAGERARLAAVHGLDPARPLLLFAGRLEGQKDPQLLLRAFTALLARRPGAHLLIAGSGGLEPLLRRESASIGGGRAVTLLGTIGRDEVARLMNAVDALVITSAFETGPTVGLEALASGLPVVTTKVGEVAEVVASSGAGAVASAHSPEAVAASLDDVLGQPREALRASASQAATPFHAATVLAALYDDNRELAAHAGLSAGPGASANLHPS